MRAKTAGRLAAAVLGVVAAAWLGAGAASAHVSVNPKDGVQGGYAKLAFRVPTEKPGAGTVKLEVVIPTDAPIASISTRPLPGWTVAASATTATTSNKLPTALGAAGLIAGLAGLGVALANRRRAA